MLGCVGGLVVRESCGGARRHGGFVLQWEDLQSWRTSWFWAAITPEHELWTMASNCRTISSTKTPIETIRDRIATGETVLILFAKVKKNFDNIQSVKLKNNPGCLVFIRSNHQSVQVKVLTAFQRIKHSSHISKTHWTICKVFANSKNIPTNR